MGPFFVGDKREFTCPISGTFARVDVLLRYPDEYELGFEAWEESTDSWVCSDIGAFELDDVHVIRWNCYTNVTDTTPVRSVEAQFQVRSTGATQAFYYEV